MTDKDRELVKQLLLAKHSYVVGGHTKHEWVNPDGPEAADLIETQAREIERLRDTPNRIWAEARDNEWDEGFNYAVKLFRAALAGDSHD